MKNPVLIMILVLTFGTPIWSQVQKPKKESKAVLLSVVNTVVPTTLGLSALSKHPALGIGLTSYGLVVGPSLGHFYADNSKVAWEGIALRGLLIGATYLISYEIYNNRQTKNKGKYDEQEEEPFFDFGGELIVFAVGNIGCIILDIADIAKARESVRNYNSKHQMSVAPRIDMMRKSISMNVAMHF